MHFHEASGESGLQVQGEPEPWVALPALCLAPFSIPCTHAKGPGLFWKYLSLFIASISFLWNVSCPLTLSSIYSSLKARLNGRLFQEALSHHPTPHQPTWSLLGTPWAFANIFLRLFMGRVEETSNDAHTCLSCATAGVWAVS